MCFSFALLNVSISRSRFLCVIWYPKRYTGASFLSPLLLSGLDCISTVAGTGKLGGGAFFGGIVDEAGIGGGFGFSAAGIADCGGGGGGRFTPAGVVSICCEGAVSTWRGGIGGGGGTVRVGGGTALGGLG